MKLAQPVPCVSAPPPAELSHPAGVWDAAVPLESLKFAVQPGPRHKTEKTGLFQTKTKDDSERLFVVSQDIWLRSVPSSTWIWCVLLIRFILIRFRSAVPLPASVLHAAPGASLWGLRDPEPGNEWQWMQSEDRWKDLEHRNSCSEENKNYKSLWGLPCSGFSLCCIVHLLLLPNVLFLFSIIKLAYPLFTAGLESSRIGLCTNKHTDKVVFLSEVSYWSS